MQKGGKKGSENMVYVEEGMLVYYMEILLNNLSQTNICGLVLIEHGLCDVVVSYTS